MNEGSKKRERVKKKEREREREEITNQAAAPLTTEVKLFWTKLRFDTRFCSFFSCFFKKVFWTFFLDICAPARKVGKASFVRLSALFRKRLIPPRPSQRRHQLNQVKKSYS